MVHFVPKWYKKMHVFLIAEGEKKPNWSFKDAIVLKMLNSVNTYVYMIYVYICIPGYM